MDLRNQYNMKIGYILVCLIVVGCHTISIAQSIDEHTIPNQLIVQIQPNRSIEDLTGTLKEIDKVSGLSSSMNIWLLTLHSTTQAATYLETLSQSPIVKAIQYNHQHIQRRNIVPNDAFFGSQWNLLDSSHAPAARADISATLAWQINHSNLTRAGDTIVIAVIDDPIDVFHEDINFFINYHEIPGNGKDDDHNGYIDDYYGWNVFDNTDTVYHTFSNHGTHVSGIAAAKGDNTKGIAGVCWGVKVMAIYGSSNTESDVVKAYDYVLSMRRLWDQTSGAKGALVVATNSSFGVGNYGALPKDYPIWCGLYDSLGKYGILSAVAAPNAHVDVDVVHDVPTECPSRYMIGVTNTTQSNQLNSKSAFGSQSVDIGAPGSGIYSCYAGSSYGIDGGTSMSTPHITGTVAALMANACTRWLNGYLAAPDSFALMLKGWVLGGVDQLTDLHNHTVSGGRLNLYHSMLLQANYDCNQCGYSITDSILPESCPNSKDGNIALYTSSNAAKTKYRWSTGDSSASIGTLSPGFYTVTVTDSAACQRQWSGTIVAPQSLFLSGITVISPTRSSVGNIIMTASAGNDKIYYSVNGSPFTTNYIYIDSVIGLKHIRIRTEYGCEIDTTIDFQYNGISVINDQVGFTIAPNPSDRWSELYISVARSMDVNIGITDILGREIHHIPVSLHEGIGTIPIDMTGWSGGLYMVSVRDDLSRLIARGRLVRE